MSFEFSIQAEYRLSPRVVSSIKSADLIRISSSAGSMDISLDLMQLLMIFVEAKTVKQAFQALLVDVSLDEFSDIVAQYVRHGLLLRHETQTSAPCLRELLNSKFFGAGSDVETIGAYMREGRAVVIPNALPEEFARRVYDELDRSTKWNVTEGGHGFFHYRSTILHPSLEYAPMLEECARIFGSANTREFMSSMSGQDCAGNTLSAAAWYRAGEYALPHDDASGEDSRSVAYIWYLTQSWHHDWGGALYWCPSGQYVMPTFNTLVMFNVKPSNVHMVCPVAPSATSKRLTVNGFWRRSDQGTKARPIAPEVAVSAAVYGGSALCGHEPLPVVVLGAERDTDGRADVGQGSSFGPFTEAPAG